MNGMTVRQRASRGAHREAVTWSRLLGLCFALALMLPLVSCHGPSTKRKEVVSGSAQTSEAVQPVAVDSAFARLVERLSEPDGYFDTDNLISNERSYLHVLGGMREQGVQGGAYLGVGPDQNFAYIAQVRPEIAFIIDIRRDNLLQHLFFKALFNAARNRLEYVCLLFGKPVPPDVAAWSDGPIEQLLAYIDETPGWEGHRTEALALVQDEVRRSGLALSDEDLAAIDRIHTQFIHAGLDLKFTSHNRPPRYYYPSYRDLLLETDLTGRQGAYLAREEDFQFIKAMQHQDLIVPVVGDLAGGHALAAIGAYLAERGMTVSAFYTSNVEFYLMRRRRFARFVENVRHLPLDTQSVIIRSYFNRFSAEHPQTVPGYASTQLLQPIERLVDGYEQGRYQTYRDLINRE